MALAPADFYAYSRATGVPVPEDPEERAQIAPQVLEFRRNQLRGPEQQSPLPGILGATALGLGALVGGAKLAGVLGRGRTQAQASKAPALTTQGVQAVRELNTPDRQRAAEAAIRQSRTERPAGVVQTDLSAIDKLLNDPSLLSLVEQQEAIESLSPTGLKEFRGKESKARNEYRMAITSLGDEIIAQERAAVRAPVINQTIGALESGEDQTTGRTMRAVQRNEDLDTSQVNQVARQTGSAAVAASLTPDGVPVDQTDPINKAQSFLEQKRLELLSSFSPTRAERILSVNPNIAEAAELYAATGDPRLLSRFSQTPSTPLTVKPTVQMSINDEELPTGQFFKPTGMPEYVGDLLAEDIELTNQISNLGAQQQLLARKAQELGEQELMLRVAMDREPASGGEYTKMFAKVKNQQQNLPDPASLNVDLGDAIAERDYVRGRIESLQNLGSTYKLTDVQEGVRPYYEYDELGKIIPSTLELRGGRKTIDLGPKTGGGRLVAEYDPAGQTGSTKGIYGVEQTSRRSAETTRPTQMTMRELVREGMEQASASPEGDVPIPPSLEQMTERIPTVTAKRSLQASEIVRRAIIEGRDPQMLLRQRGFNV